MHLSEFQKRKLALVFYRHDIGKDGLVSFQDLEICGSRVAQLQQRVSQANTPEKMLFFFKKLWNRHYQPADLDSDGRVALEEYLTYNDFFWPDRKLELELMGSLFDAIDLNGDGQISWEEYAIYLRALEIEENIAQHAFSKLDLDGDGQIARQEYAKYLYEYHFGNDPEAIGNWFYGSY
ncbi:MAG: EF-hand domain-containing protein [Chloroflexaceae bacterium]|nr:EF-hand domain-containing protein [Chloroflexaceae bacterium]